VFLAREYAKTSLPGTGNRVTSEELGLKLENVTISDLGRAKGVSLDKEHTTDGATLLLRQDSLIFELATLEVEWRSSMPRVDSDVVVEYFDIFVRSGHCVVVARKCVAEFGLESRET
jgi:hypothetical protein